MRAGQRRILREVLWVLFWGVLPIFLLGAFTYPPCAEEPPSPFPYVQLSTPVHVVLIVYAYAAFVIAPVVAIRRSGLPLSLFGFRWHGAKDVRAGIGACAANATGW